MMTPFFQLCFANATVQTSLGISPMRLYPFGAVPADTIAPYGVYREASGTPENYLGSRSDIDSVTVQFEVYASTGDEVSVAFSAVRDAVEASAYVITLRGAALDPETLLVAMGCDFDFWMNR